MTDTRFGQYKANPPSSESDSRGYVFDGSNNPSYKGRNGPPDGQPDYWNRIALGKNDLPKRGSDKTQPNYMGKYLLDGNVVLANQDVKGADFGDANMEGMDIRFADLSGSFMRGANLRGANLRGANLTFTDLQDSNLENADLGNRAYLLGADLRWANLRNAYFDGSRLRGADLRSTDLRDADLDNAKVRNAKFDEALLQGARFPHVGGAILKTLSLRGTFLFNGDMSDYDLKPKAVNDLWLEQNRHAGLKLGDGDIAEIREIYAGMERVADVQRLERKAGGSCQAVAEPSSAPDKPSTNPIPFPIWVRFKDSKYRNTALKGELEQQTEHRRRPRRAKSRNG